MIGRTIYKALYKAMGNRLGVGSLLLLVMACGSVQAKDTARLESQARELVQAFVGELKPTLKSAMEQGGPRQAIAVCATEAPGIASRLSRDSGWSVNRVSLQPRNRDTAIADDWEREQLQRFEQRQQQGEAAADLHVGEVVENQYRYMQAQVVQPLCLACHGQSLSPDVKEALAEHYPEDTATGYELGEVRGAISLSKTLEE